MSYFYLVASLPTLRMEQAPPCTPEDFLFQCAGSLCPEHRLDLERLLGGGGEPLNDPVSQQWQDADTQLRNAIARRRAAQRGVDPKPWLRSFQGFDVAIEAAVEEASGKANPLERERVVDRCRWRMLEELAGKEPFGWGAVLAHAVQLGIAGRWANMRESEGRDYIDGFLHDQIHAASVT